MGNLFILREPIYICIVDNADPGYLFSLWYSVYICTVYDVVVVFVSQLFIYMNISSD